MQATYHPRKATQAPLKPTKFEAGYKVLCKQHYTALVEVRIEGEPLELYTVSSRIEGLDGVQKVESPRGRYTVNVNRGECTCEGNRRGYLCRHLRLVAKMNRRGDV